MQDNGLHLFGARDTPDVQTAWRFYEKGKDFNNQINLNATVQSNENFYVGKQWENVESNGLPTVQDNFLKRVVGFITATITTDNISAVVAPLEATANTKSLVQLARIVNEELAALIERNKVQALIRRYARDAAVRGDGCLYSYWDSTEKTGQKSAGAIKTEVLENTRVFFGNPSDSDVQTQPYIIIENREIARSVRLRAKANKSKDWMSITPDVSGDEVDAAKYVDDLATVLLTLWRDEKTGEIWAYESTRCCTVKEPWNLGINLYPICWLNWDYIADSYHGQAMITGLIPNQIATNKMWSMSVLSTMKNAFPKIVYDSSRIKKWDNRVGTAVGIPGGDVNTVARIIDPAPISPQVSQLITQLVQDTEQSLGATSVALGDTRPDNTSAIIALQRAAATPTETTKQNLYQSMEDLFRIYMDFMAKYYGERIVDVEPPDPIKAAYMYAGMPVPDEIAAPFDFSVLEDHPMTLKLDVGASSYYSEIAAMSTLDNLLMNGHITAVEYLERVPESYVPAKKKLIQQIEQRMGMAQDQTQMPTPTGNNQSGPLIGRPDIPTGGGYSSLQRKINATGTTAGLV